MLGPITFTVEGPPRGKGRPRAFRRGNAIAMFTDDKTEAYERSIGLFARQAMRGAAPFGGPVEIVVSAIFPIPASWSKLKQSQAVLGAIRPSCKPDLSNILKSVEDGMNNIAYFDDAQIVRFSCAKRYGPQPMVVVTVKEVG
jgi:Holliday junction resolvase RusA-like endonuclease